MTHRNRKPTPRYDSLEQREAFQMQVFAFAVFVILAATVATCVVHDVRMTRAVDAIIAQTSANTQW